MIELRRLSKHFADTTAVDAIDLSIARGELCVLVGTSGCGKSTTLRMINRLIEYSEGTLMVDGRPIDQLDAVQLRRRMGYAIQSTGLFPHWTVAQNIGLVPRLLKWPKSKIAQRVDELLNLLNMPAREFADKYPQQLSGGQAQRVGVARALAGDPDILLMDEPFAALDPITRSNLQDELLRILHQMGKTIVFVTHDIDEALKLADRIVIMDQGRIVQQGSAHELLSQPANEFVSQLLGKADRGLKQASLRQVQERMQPNIQGYQSEQPSISAKASLKQALSAMLWHQQDYLWVLDHQQQPQGLIELADIIPTKPQHRRPRS